MKTMLRWMRSTRLAVALILILALLSLAGIFLPQVPASLAATSGGYAWWVENVTRDSLGDIAYTLKPLGVFQIFRSVWFICAVALLMLNILACTLGRVRSLRAQSQNAEILQDADFYTQGRMTVTTECNIGLSTMAGRAQQVLKGYAAVREDAAGAVFFAGSKHRFSVWGTLLVHTSLLLLLAGVVAGSLLGFREDSLIVVEGAQEEIGYGTQLQLKLVSFTDTYWEDGTPKDYSSDVVLYQDGAQVKSGIIQVNHPLRYRGVRVYQSSFGSAAELTIADQAGNVAFHAKTALTATRTTGDLTRPMAQIELPDSHYTVVLLGSADNGADPYIGQSQIGLEYYDENMVFVGWLLLERNASARLDGLVFSAQSLQYSGFLVSKNPGTFLVWTAAFLFLIGFFMIFDFPYRRLWIRLRRISDDTTEAAIRIDTKRDQGPEAAARLIAGMLGSAEQPKGEVPT